jgi:hypothetical protein
MCSSCSVARPLSIAAYSIIAFHYTCSQSSNTARVRTTHTFHINKHVCFFAALVPSTDSEEMEHSKSSSLQLSNKQLHDLLTGTPARNLKGLEEGASEFESGTLGWPQPASMTNGNPKQKD